MARSLKAQLESISLGVVLVLFWAWIYIRIPQLYPSAVDEFRTLITTYIIFTALVFSFDALSSKRTETPLFRVSFVKAFPKFLIFAVAGLVVLFLFGLTLKSEALPSIYGAVKGLGIGVLLLHAFFIATLEEKVFRSWTQNELQAVGFTKMNSIIASALVFAFFHYLLNGQWLTILIYIPLGLIFSFIREKFSPETDMANSGAHFAWNVFILGFLS